MMMMMMMTVVMVIQICDHICFFIENVCTGLFELAKLQDVSFVLSLSAADLQRLTRLSATDVATLHRAVAEAVPHPAPATGLDYKLSASFVIPVQYRIERKHNGKLGMHLRIRIVK